MSMYTTGEIAKLCGVSVRTVQYYDSRKILVPSELSEGGRRLYTEDDLKRMEIICFLRETGLPINSISALLAEEKPEKIILILLEQQEQALHEELSERQKKLHMIENIKRELKGLERFSVDSIGDIANIMKNRNKLRKLRATLLITGIPVTALQWVSIILWIMKGIWWLFALWVGVAAVYGVWVSVYYFKNVAYICPECHAVFKPGFKEAFWAYHTPKMRRLTCPKCGYRGLCVEVYDENNDMEKNKS
ncbi:MAG: MerR family transcriptional regulator [Clostridiales bacterium]|nr:MerR family transcriptional regulator [Clostridiales bacterium]